MSILLQVLNTMNSKSSVAESVFGAVGALANAFEEDFQKYMESFAPFLYRALGNKEDPNLCAMAIGLVSDVTRSLGPAAQPYCDNFMNHLLENLKVCRALKHAKNHETHKMIEHCLEQPIQARHLAMLWRHCTKYLWCL